MDRLCPIALLGIGALGAGTVAVGKYKYDHEVAPVLNLFDKQSKKGQKLYAENKERAVVAISAAILFYYWCKRVKSNQISLEKSKKFLRTRTTNPVQDIGVVTLTTTKIQFKEDEDETLRRLRNEFLTRVLNRV